MIGILTLQRLTLDDLFTIKPCFAFSKNRACDNTPGDTFMWRDYFNSEFALYDSTLILKVDYLDKVNVFAMPVGKNVPGALEQIKGYCTDKGIACVIVMASSEDVEEILSLYDARVEKDSDDWADYLYDAKELSEFKGKKFNGQRNHINNFERLYPDFHFEKISAENIPAVLDFYDEYLNLRKKESEFLIEDEKKTVEVLENFEKYQMDGLALFVGKRAVAFDVGEVLRDTLFVHIEKAHYDYRGAYQMIVREYVRENLSKGIKYVNREDDAGDPGLRTSKLSYHPLEIISKYNVYIK